MTTTADYAEKVPNNVDLREDRRLQRALESWQPNFLNWWQTMGPTLPTQDDYLRTAVNVGREGWAHFGHVPMKDYRWGIFVAERDPGRRVGFGQHKGEPPWTKVPGEYRADLQRLIVIQGDTEPEFCREGLPSFKRPRRIVFVSEYPTTGTGKIRRVELRQIANDAGLLARPPD